MFIIILLYDSKKEKRQRREEGRNLRWNQGRKQTGKQVNKLKHLGGNINVLQLIVYYINYIHV